MVQAPQADLDMEAELAKFEADQRARLGLESAPSQWVETMANAQFTASERAKVTLLVSGLTLAHDYLAASAIEGLGYNVLTLECPTNEALRFGKEFGNRGQCNPTYFTVGNLVKFLCYLRDEKHLSASHIISHYVFLTAGACGPCRFGMYVTEYRKALRDAGFDGFRVILFQQTGGFAQATGEDVGLRLDFAFFSSLTKALLIGDVINALGYRLRPYELDEGATDRAIETAKQACRDALVSRRSILIALVKVRRAFAQVRVDRTVPKPKVSIIGEFWAMTTEGDGNYQLQRFLESEGAEVDIQLITAWLLYMIWEGKTDTKNRKSLRGADNARTGLASLGTWGAGKRELTLWGADRLCRILFQTYAHAAGLYGYHLPDMEHIAQVAHQHYDNDLRGGEGHMEVGKLIQNVVMNKSHMTVSVKPFGCMPSAGVSDGVQSLITEKYPGTIFCAVETSGDGRVNFYSRVQMYLFKAKAAAHQELERVCQEQGVTIEQTRHYLKRHRRFAAALHKPPHRAAGTAADVVIELAPLMTKPALQRWTANTRNLARSVITPLPKSKDEATQIVVQAKHQLVTLANRCAEDIAMLWDAWQSRSSAAQAAE